MAEERARQATLLGFKDDREERKKHPMIEFEEDKPKDASEQNKPDPHGISGQKSLTKRK